MKKSLLAGDKEILSRLEITSLEAEKKNWSSYLVWSDLYKVASPEGGNPSTKLCNAQLDKCGRLLLKEEIAYYKPKRNFIPNRIRLVCDF